MSLSELVQNRVAESLSLLLSSHPELQGITVVYTWKPELDARQLAKGIMLFQKDLTHNLGVFLRTQQNLSNYRDAYVRGFLEAAARTGRRPEILDKQPDAAQGEAADTG